MSLSQPAPRPADETLVDTLRLIRTPNVGPITFFQLIRRYGDAAHALDALPELSQRGGSKKPLTAMKRDDALKEIEACEKFGARMIAYGTPDYPALLAAVPDAPPIITVHGHAHLWKNKQLVAMVGARNASANGCQLAQKLAQDVGRQGMTVVSGLARGIDAFVHKGSLASGTVAVIAGGIDNIYPPENEKLYAQIREQGCVISEQPFGSIPFAGSFPGRNRIIAGMTSGTVVVEANLKSGSLITARLALDYNREVFAVPGSPLDPRAKGCNQLLRDGAILVENAADIVHGIAQANPMLLRESATPFSAQQISEASEGELDEARKNILEKLGTTPVAVDVLIEQCAVSTAATLTVLLELELAGRIQRSAGGKVMLVPDLE